MSEPIMPSGFFSLAASGNQNTAVPPPPLPGSGQMQQTHFLYNYSNSQQLLMGSSRMGMMSEQEVAGSSQTGEAFESQEEWTCEACKLTLDSRAALEAHTASHIRCESCSFTGAPKVVKAHHQAVHGRFSGSGFKSVTISVPGCPVQRFKICVGNRPEDVRKWVEERRSRFPRMNKAPIGSNDSAATEIVVAQASGDNKEAQKEGISSLLDGYSSSDDDLVTPTQEAPAKQGGTRFPESHEAKSATPNRKFCRFFAKNGSCRNGDACTFSHDRSNRTPSGGPSDRAFGHPIKKQRREDPSLLQRLLLNDVRRENTIALQLLEFIVQSDFLQD